MFGSVANACLDLIRKMGSNGRRYCENHYNKGIRMDRMDCYLKLGGK